MAVTSVDICNMALGWLGANLIIAFTDPGKEAALCVANYEPARDAVLEDGDWTFASRVDKLAMLAAPTVEGYPAFKLPTDVIRPKKTDDGTWRWRLDWERRADSVVLLPGTDGQTSLPDVCYCNLIFRLEDTTKFSPAFAVAVAARLAADLAIPIANSRQLQSDMWSLYERKVEAARATDGQSASSQRLTSEGRLTRRR